jgi:hypothetical protein
MQALSFGAAAVVVAIGAWIFFDATDRGRKYAWLWAVGFLLLAFTVLGAVLVLIIYFATRNSGTRHEVADGAALRLYLIVATFTSLALMVAGAAAAAAAGLLYAVSDHLSNNDFRDLAASALAAFIVGAAVWWPHWRAVGGRLGTLAGDDEFRASYVVRHAEILMAIFVFGVVAVGNALVVLGGGIAALFHTTHADAAWWLPELGVVIVTGAAAWYHVEVLRRAGDSSLGRRFRGIPAPPPIESRPPAVAAYPSAPQGYPPTAQAYAPMAPAGYPPGQPTPVWAPPVVGTPATPAPSTAAGGEALAPAPVQASAPAPGPAPASAPTSAPSPPPAPVPAPAAAPTAQSSTSAYCTRCGNPVAAGDAFCRACGTKIAPAVLQDGAPQPVTR